jgi:circadian clock protein KaiB
VKSKKINNKKRGLKKLRLNSSDQFEKLLKNPSLIERYSLSLYVTGTTARSTKAIANIRALCDEFLKGRYELKVIDIYQQPDETMNAQIIAAPTLIKRLPTPLKRLIGDLSDRNKLIVGLDLRLGKTGKI